MKIYKSCKTLSIFRFYEILDTKDYKYLIEDYENTEITEELQLQLDDIWSELFKEYIDLKKDRTLVQSFKKRQLIAKMETRLVFGINLLKALIIQTDDKWIQDYIDALSLYNFKIDINKDLETECIRIKNNLKTLKSNISIKKNQYENDYGSKNNEEPIDIDKQIYSVEKALDMSYHIMKHNTSVKEWITLINLTIETTKKNK